MEGIISIRGLVEDWLADVKEQAGPDWEKALVMPAARKRRDGITKLPEGARDWPPMRQMWIRRSNFYREWREITDAAKASGLIYENEPVAPHAFRHWFASTLLRSGDFSVRRIADLLGHARIDLLLNIYSHVLDVDEDEQISL